MDRLRIGFIGFDGVAALDMVGPAETFAAASEETDGEQLRRYETFFIGLTAKPFVSEIGIVFQPHYTLQNAPALDTLIVPGGSGLRKPDANAKVSAWVKSHASQIRRVASVCTGIYGLAPTGLLDGRRVTTHWRWARDVEQRYPALKVDPNALFLKDGQFYTSAGSTAGIDLALALIEEDHGPRVAVSVARELVVYLKRQGGQAQYSEPLKFQAQSTDQFSDLAAWMTSHLHHDLSVDALAERARLCPRHFSRRFKHAFGTTPAAYVDQLRMGEAQHRLTLPNQTIERVAASVGFKGADAFRRAFERRFGVTPSSYRGRFQTQSKNTATPKAHTTTLTKSENEVS